MTSSWVVALRLPMSDTVSGQLRHQAAGSEHHLLCTCHCAQDLMLQQDSCAAVLLQSILEACEADLQSCVDRDPACEKFSQCMLYFKGFQAIQCHRLNHWLWQNNRKVGLLSSMGTMPPACYWLICSLLTEQQA